MIAVDADSVNLAYIRKSLERNALWENGAVRLINNAVRLVIPVPVSSIVYHINFKYLQFAVTPEVSSTFPMTRTQ